jgi:hypothetical protein
MASTEPPFTLSAAHPHTWWRLARLVARVAPLPQTGHHLLGIIGAVGAVGAVGATGEVPPLL